MAAAASPAASSAQSSAPSPLAIQTDPDSLPRNQRQRRDRIVEAALHLLERHEYDSIQVRDVAVEAKVALATLYRYFSSKEHLYAAVLLEWAADYPAGLDQARGPDAQTRIRALMRRAVRAFERYPQVMRVVIVLESSDDANARALFDEFAQRNNAALMAALSSLEPATASAIVETANAVMVTRLRSWALGRASIRDVQRSVERALDLVFSPSPTAS